MNSLNLAELNNNKIIKIKFKLSTMIKPAQITAKSFSKMMLFIFQILPRQMGKKKIYIYIYKLSKIILK